MTHEQKKAAFIHAQNYHHTGGNTGFILPAGVRSFTLRFHDQEAALTAKLKSSKLYHHPTRGDHYWFTARRSETQFDYTLLLLSCECNRICICAGNKVLPIPQHYLTRTGSKFSNKGTKQIRINLLDQELHMEIDCKAVYPVHHIATPASAPLVFPPKNCLTRIR